MEATENILERAGGACHIFKSEDKLLRPSGSRKRTNFDVEMMRETGFCSGLRIIPVI